MKVVLVTPNYHQPRGNTVTVKRISEGLQDFGISTEIVSITESNPFPTLPQADLVHGFNAYQFYRFWVHRGSSACPYVVTLTGTDLNHSLFHAKTKDAVIQSLFGSRAIHVFNEEARNLLWQAVPGLQDKTCIIPQGIHVFPPAAGHVKKEEGSFLFVLPAGIRKVKNVPAAISMLASLYEQDPSIRLWITGPILEKEEGNKVRSMVEQNARWARYLGQVPHREMGEIYRCADAVLNTSLSEGQSSAVLEAMSMGIPVVVSDIPGNRDIVPHGKAGFIYRNEEEFSRYARRLMESKELRQEMGTLGKEYVQAHHSFEAEIQAIVSIYRKVLD